MELKSQQVMSNVYHWQGSNRTFMELKSDTEIMA